jgi:hypothetical protein|tara:strand:+ start:331 stop:822 length:492 start_codon:yes stop_codon:yes gene_type:complete
MDHNPYKLKQHEVDWQEKEKPPAGYLDADAFLKFLNRKGAKIERADNLPRFGDNNGIKMIKVTRDGKYGSVPTYYLPPSEFKLQEIIQNLKNNNNSLAGREALKKKKQEILRIFDDSKDNTESKTSIAEKVEKKLNVNCNRKLVRKVLEKKRSSQLKKLKKIN